MKKLYVLLLVTATVFSATQAQTTSDLQFKKGDKLLGGSISLNNSNPSGNDNDQTIIALNPSFGVFTKPNRLTGVSLSFGYSSGLNKSRSYGASVYKQYWNSLGKNFYFIVQGQLAASYLDGDYRNSSFPGAVKEERKEYGVSANLSSGFAYRINKRLVVDAFLPNMIGVSTIHSKVATTYYNGPTTTTVSKSDVTYINVSSNLSNFSFNNIQIGFRYIL